MITHEFHPTQRFDGEWFPRHDSQPNGPKDQSFVKCVCGAYWKNHRFVDSACPVVPQEKHHVIQT
jgi:hypothetical protein